MEYAYSIIMLSMGIALMLYAAIAYLSGDMPFLPNDAYSLPNDAKQRKQYTRKVSKLIALIAVAFIISSLVGFTLIYWLAVATLIVGIVAAIIIYNKLINGRSKN